MLKKAAFLIGWQIGIFLLAVLVYVGLGAVAVLYWGGMTVIGLGIFLSATLFIIGSGILWFRAFGSPGS